MRRSGALAGALLVLGVASAQEPAGAPARLSLRHDLEVGTEFAYGIEVGVEIEQQLDGVEERTSLRFQLWFQAKVEADGPPKRVAHKVQRVVARTDSKLAKIDFDSDLAGSEPGAMEPLAKLVGETFQVHVDALGRIARVEAPAGVRADPQQFADFDSLFAVFFVPLPEQPVGRADRWVTDARLLDPKTVGKGVVPCTHTVAKVDGDVVVLEDAYDVGDPRRPGVKFEVLAAKGSVLFDHKAGRVKASEMELAARATREIGGGKSIRGVSRVRVKLL